MRSKATIILLSSGLVLLLALLLGPRLAAAAANNLAVIELASEWAPVSQDLDVPRCRARLDQSAARPYLSAALRWDPEGSRALLNQGRAHWLEGRCGEAYQAWAEAHDLAPADEMVDYWLFWASRDVAGGEHAFGRPDALAVAAYYGAWRASAAGDRAAMTAWYAVSFELDPNRKAATRLASAYRGQGLMDEAAAVWDALARALPPDQADHWWAVAQAAELERQWEPAAEAYGRGAALADDPFDFWLRQGDMWRLLERWPAAEASYRQALASQPDSARAQDRLQAVQAEGE